MAVPRVVLADRVDDSCVAMRGSDSCVAMAVPRVVLADRVKQADTVMLSYPLGMQMPPSVLANDLAYYTLLTVGDGPAMTWANFAVGWMEVALQDGNAWSGNFTNAVKFFNRGCVALPRLSSTNTAHISIVHVAAFRPFGAACVLRHVCVEPWPPPVLLSPSVSSFSSYSSCTHTHTHHTHTHTHTCTPPPLLAARRHAPARTGTHRHAPARQIRQRAAALQRVARDTDGRGRQLHHRRR